MAQNTFDEAVLQLAREDPLTLRKSAAKAPGPAAVNPFDDAVKQLSGEQSRTRVNLNTTQTPDHQAEIDDLSRRSGVSTDIVGRNFDTMAADQAAADIPAAAIQNDSPILHEGLADPDFANLAADDLEVQGWLEWMVNGSLGRAGQVLGLGRGPMEAARARGVAQIEVGRLTMQQALGGTLSTVEASQLAEAIAVMETEDPKDYWWWQDAFLGPTEIMPTIEGATLEAAKWAAGGAAVGAAAGATVGGVGALPGAAAGAKIFGTAGAMSFAFELEGGLALHEFSQWEDEHGNKLDPQVALGAALTVGSLNAGIEVVQLGLLVRMFPPIAAAATAARRITTREAAKRALKSPTTRAMFRSVAQRWALTTAGEVGTEVLQEEVTMGIGELAKQFDESSDIPLLSVEEKRARREGIIVDSFAAMALLPVPGAMVRVGVGARNVQQARKGREFFQALGEAVPNSKLLERAPAALSGQLDKALKDGPLEFLSLPSDTFETYWQGLGQDPALIAEQLTGDPKAFEKARRTGADLQVKTSAYAAQLAGTDHNAFFVNELRLTPEGMNGREVDEITARVEAAAEGEANPDIAAIEADLLEKFTEANVDDPAGQASFVANFYAVMGERAGVEPAQLAAQYDLAVNRPDATGPALEQGPALGKAVFSEDVVGNEDTLGGLDVINADQVPNQSSIEASLTDFEVLPGIRRIPMSQFPDMGVKQATVGQEQSAAALEQEIRDNGQITPLIVVEDEEGLYILEGSSRITALARIGVDEFPAMVVRDLEGRTDLEQGPVGGTRIAAIEANERLSEEADAFANQVKVDLGLQDFNVATFGERHPNILLLDLLRVPAERRKEGLGSQAMARLTEFADARGLTVILTPATAVAGETTSRSRLVKFYRRFGFVENRGRRARFELPIQGGMFRPPSVVARTPGGVSFNQEALAAAVPVTSELAASFETWFASSVVANPDGSPRVMYHGGTFDATLDDIFDTTAEGAHFGTKNASLDRIGGRQVDSRIANVTPFETANGWAWEMADFNMASLEDEFYDTELEAIRAGERAAIEDATASEIGEGDAVVTPVLLSIQNPLRVPDLGTWGFIKVLDAVELALEHADNKLAADLSIGVADLPADLRLHPADRTRIERAHLGHDVEGIVEAGDASASGWQSLKLMLEQKGFDGFIYFNEVEDKGKDSYVVFRPEQVKSPQARSFSVTSPGILFQPARPWVSPDQILAAPTEVVDERWRPSARVPTTATRQPPTDGRALRMDLEVILARQNTRERSAAEYRSSRLVRPTARRATNDKAVLDETVRVMGANLEKLWNAFPSKTRDRARHWYLGAHRMAGELADEFGFTLAQVAVVIAAQSPQKDWNQNISLARRVISTMTRLDAHDSELPRTFNKTLFARYIERAEVGRDKRADTIRKRLIEKGQSPAEAQAAADAHIAKKTALLDEDRARYQGKRWEDLDRNGQARMLRMVDELHTDPGFNIHMPEGEVVGPALNNDGTPAKFSWGDYPTIVNSLSALRDGSQPNLDARVGFEHKVRSFYGNILDPTNPHLVTIDTHSVAASWFSPFGASQPEVKGSLSGAGRVGAPSSAITGVSGFNGVLAEAHFRLAAKLTKASGQLVLPREVQSVTWEAIRAVYSSANRQNETFIREVEELWESYTSGKITLGRLHDVLIEKAGGIRSPDWGASTPRVAADQIQLRPSDARARRPGVPAARRRRGTGAVGPARPDATRADRPPVGAVFLQPSIPDGPRGRIVFGEHSVSIDLFSTADPSTLIHETGHFYLKVLTDVVAGLPGEARTTEQQQLSDDLGTALAWLGVADAGQIETKQHEQWARGFEAYLREGKAPSAQLRGLFARFRTWLTHIYRQVDDLNVELNDDIRAVFDRLVATDAAIEGAQSEAGVTPLITDPASVGMTEEAFAAYTEQVTAESLRAQEQVQARLMEDLAREESRLFKDARRRVASEVTADVQSRPVYRAHALIRRGLAPDGSPVRGITEPQVLNRDDIIAESGPEVLDALKRRFLYRLEDGVPARLVSELIGYSSPDEMLQDLASMPPQAATITRETDARMAAEHPDLLSSPEQLRQVAVEAIAGGEGREAIVRAELAALEAAVVTGTQTARGQITRRVLPTASVINNAARARIEGMRGREVKPGLFLQAAQRASAQAHRLLAQNEDRAGALDAKVQQLINMALYREGLKARTLFDTRLAWVRDHNTSAARARIAQAGANYLQQWDQFLSDYEFARVSVRDLDKRVSLKKFVAGLEAAGLPVDMPDEVLDEANATNYREMTVEQFRAVTDAMQHLLKLGRLKNKLLRANEKRRLDEVVSDLVTELTGNSKGRRELPLESSLPPEMARFGRQSFFAWGRKFASYMRQMDGGKDNGPLWDALVRPGNTAANNELDMRAAATETLTEALKVYTNDELMLMNTPKVVPNAGLSLSRAGRIMIALNWGNAQNRQRVLDGFGWEEEQGQAILDSLVEKDWSFINTVWTQVDSYWPAIVAKQTRVYGFAPEKVESTAFETRFGTQPGGYFPIKYDPNRDQKAFSDSIKEIAESMAKGAASIATTRRGFTKTRFETVKGRPVKLDFTVFFQHINEVIHDLTHHEYLIDANRIIGHPAFRTAVQEHYGPATYIELQNQLEAVAAGTIPQEHHSNRMLTRIINGSSVAAMGHNLMTAAVQFTGISVSMVRVGPTWVARGLAEWMGDAVRMEATVSRIQAESALMRARPKTFNREVAEVQNKITPPGADIARALNTEVPSKARQAASRAAFRSAQTLRIWQDTYFYFIARAQMSVDVVTYLGAKNKALSTMDPDVAEDKREQLAIDLAEQAVIDSQGSGLIKDLSQVQRTQSMKLFTQFMSYFNVIYQQGAENHQAWVRRQNPISFARMAVNVLMLYSIPMVIEEVSREALRGDSGEEREDGFMLWLAKNQLSYLLATVVGFRELGGVLQGYRYGGPAATRIADAAGRAMMEVTHIFDPNKDFDFLELLEAANETAGVWYGYPAVTVERVARTLYGLAEDPDEVGEAFNRLFGGRPELQ